MVDTEACKSTREKKNRFTIKEVYSFIQAVANIAVVVALLFTLGQYLATIRPTLQEQNLIKAQALINTGQFHKAINLYNSHLLNTNPVALNNLGVIYERGLGVEKDYEKAKEYYRESSSVGSEKAIYNLIHLNIEDFSPESAKEVAQIVYSAYETKNDRIVQAASSLVDFSFDIRSPYYETYIHEGSYDFVFRDNAAVYEKLLIAKANDLYKGEWVLVDTLYSRSSTNAFTHDDTKVEYDGAESHIFPDGSSGILYRSKLYKRNKWNFDNFELGMEIVNKEK